MARMTQPMIDNGGTLSYGAGRTPWSTVVAREREDAYGDWDFRVEPAQGWDGYTYLVTINGHPYLTDGDEPPSDPGL